MFIYCSVDGHLHFFQFLAITDKASMDSCVQVFEGVYPPTKC